jgi:nitroreductase
MQPAIENSAIIESLNWRYATKRFDASRKIARQDLDEILEALRLSPSSYGLQPWKFIVIADRDLRRTLRTFAYDQPQITDASHLVLLCVRKDLDAKFVRRYVESIAETRKTGIGSLKDFEDSVLSTTSMPKKEKEEWAARQVYIALGFLLSACAQKRIDACPMEGFEKEKFDEVLGLDKENLKSAVLCAIGYRAKDDRYASLKKVRFGKKDVFDFR